MSKSFQRISDYLSENPGKSALDISLALNMSRNTIDEILRNGGGFIRREKVFSGRVGYRNAKIMHFIYFVTNDEDDPILNQKVVRKKYEPTKIEQHPIMRAMYGF